MLAPAPGSPLPFELAPIVAPLGEAGADALVRGPVDVVAPGMLLVARELLLENCRPSRSPRWSSCARGPAPPACAVICRPGFACEAPPADARRPRPRRRAARAAEAPRAGRRLPPAAGGAPGRRSSANCGSKAAAGCASAAPPRPLTILVHGEGAELAAPPRARARPRGARGRRPGRRAAGRAARARRPQRPVAHAAQLPDAAALDALVETLESAPFVALAAPTPPRSTARCVLIAAGRFPQHVEPAGATLAAALRSLVAAARAAPRGARAGLRARSRGRRRARPSTSSRSSPPRRPR